MKAIKPLIVILILLLGLLIFYSLKKDSPNRYEQVFIDEDKRPSQTDSPELLFQSGFEGISLSSPEEDYQYLKGKDTQTGYSWPVYILGSDFSGIHMINDDNGKAITNRLEKVNGPMGNMTTTLYQEVTYDVHVTQTPYQINNIKRNPKELYISYWIKTDTLSLLGKDQWRAIWEYKTRDYGINKGFRMIAYMAQDIHGRPLWIFQGDRNPQEPIWQVENYTIPLIKGKWFKVEFYIKWSESQDGYAFMKVNDQLIGEHQGPTTHNDQPMDFIMLTQVYGNSFPMYQWVDDIKIWNGLPN